MRRYFQTKLAPYQRMFKTLNQYPWALVGLLVSAFLTALSEGLGVGLVIPLLQNTQESTNSLNDFPVLGMFGEWLKNWSFADRVRWVALMLVLLALGRGIFSYMNHWLSIWFQARTEQTYKSQVFELLLDVDLKFVHREREGNLITVLNNYTLHIGNLILNICRASVGLFTIFIYTILMFVVSWELTLVALVLLALVFNINKRLFSQRIKQSGEAVNESLKSVNAVGLESLSGMQLIHLFVREKSVSGRFEQSLNQYCQKQLMRGRLFSLLQPTFSTLNAIILSLLLVTGTFFLPLQNPSWGALLLLFLVILYRLMAPATSLNSTRGVVMSAYPSLQAVNEFLDRNNKPFLQDGNQVFTDLKTQIEFDRVEFAYHPDEPNILKNVNFTIIKDKLTAIVGPSGSGKTSLVNLITRLYDAQEGQIRVDGQKLSDLTLDSWRSQLAVVSQETFIFNDTVAANLRFAKENADQQELEQAARLAQAHEFIVALPQGYHTLLGDRGVRLSGGQRQRIAIARAFLADPQLLILDEATSSLDSSTERAIQTAIDALSRQRTVLAIAHRLSTVRQADNIVVLVDGQVVEQGTHDELIQIESHYQKMVQMQQLEASEKIPHLS